MALKLAYLVVSVECVSQYEFLTGPSNFINCSERTAGRVYYPVSQQ